MFLRRNGSRLQVIRAYRDDEGKPRQENLGVVGVFDKRISRASVPKLSRVEMQELKAMVARERAAVLVRSRAILKALENRCWKITDDQLLDEKIYSALEDLANLCM